MPFKKLGLDPSKFKHVSSDDKTTILQHKDGHQLKIAHNALAPKMQEQLKALSKIGSEAQTESQKNESKDKYGKVTIKDDGQLRKNFASGGQTAMPDDSTSAPVEDQTLPDFSADVSMPPTGTTYADTIQQDIPEGPIKVAGPGELMNKIISPIPEQDPLLHTHATMPQAGGQLGAVEQEAQAPTLAPEEQKALDAIKSNPQVSSEVTRQPAGGLSDAFAGSEGSFGAGLSQREAGIRQGAKAQQDLADQTTKMLAKRENELNNFHTQTNTQMQEAAKAVTDAEQALREAKVNPELYWTGDKDGNGSHSRVASAIGMILAGFNPAGHKNMAIEMFRYQMDKSIEAQKENLGIKKSLLEANFRKYQNVKDAVEMTRLQLNENIQNQLQMAQAQAQSPIAKAAAQQAIGQLKMDAAPMLQQFAMRRAMMGLASGQHGNDPTDTGTLEQLIAIKKANGDLAGAKDIEDHLVPGVGSNYGHGPAVSEAVRENLNGHKEFDMLAKKYADFAAQHAGNWKNLNVMERKAIQNQGAAMAAELQGAYRRASKGGTFKEGEQQFIEGLIPSQPAVWRPDVRVLPQINTLVQTNDNNFNILKKSLGLPVIQQQRQIQGQSPSQAAPQIKVDAQGIKWMRGPNGEAIRVK